MSLKQIDLLALLANVPPINPDRSVGLEYCFSPRGILRLLEVGASPDEMLHLRSCPICREIVISAATVERLLIDKHPNAPWAARFGATLNRLFLNASATELIPAILGLTAPVIRASQADNLVISCEVFPCREGDLRDIVDPTSLQLSGAVLAAEGELLHSTELPIVTFHGRLAPDVRKHILRSARVLETIQVSGRLRNSPEDGAEVFLGQATVEVVRT